MSPVLRSWLSILGVVLGLSLAPSWLSADELSPARNVEKSAVSEGRRDLTNPSKSKRLLTEFSGAMSHVGRWGGSPEKIAQRKEELLAVNAGTLKWARSTAQTAPERNVPPQAGDRKALSEVPLRQQLAAMISEIHRQKATPEEIIASVEKFQRDNAEAFEAAKRNPDESPALIIK